MGRLLWRRVRPQTLQQNCHVFPGKSSFIVWPTVCSRLPSPVDLLDIGFIEAQPTEWTGTRPDLHLLSQAYIAKYVSAWQENLNVVPRIAATALHLRLP